MNVQGPRIGNLLRFSSYIFSLFIRSSLVSFALIDVVVPENIHTSQLRIIIMLIAGVIGRRRQSPSVLGGEGQSLGTKHT